MDPTIDQGKISPASAVVEEEAQTTKTIPFEFTGKADEYFQIWIVNVCLTIVTLGVYSAWAKVRKKRYLYGNTWLQGTSFEYLGDPSKILKGRLIIGGGLLIYFVASFFLPFVDEYSWLLFLLILPWLVVMARTFTAREAFKVFFGLALIGATGLGYPYFVCRRTEFVVSHSRYGTTPLALPWQNGVKTFYAIYLAAGVIFVTLFFVIVMILMPILSQTLYPFMVPQTQDQQHAPWLAAIPVFLSFFLSMGLLVYLPAFAYLKTSITKRNSQDRQHCSEPQQLALTYLTLISVRV